MDYSLNLDYNIKRLVLISLTKYKKREDQAKALGRTVKWLQNYMKDNGLFEDWELERRKIKL